MKHQYMKHYDEHIYIQKISSGLTIVALPKPDVKTTYAAIALPFGSCHINFKIDNKTYRLPHGSAHFFEHKIYASQEGDMFSKFVKLGLDPNAMTSYDTTTYFFSATKHIFEGIDLLFETLDHPYFTDENIRSEQLIINEEINMDKDDIMTSLYQRLYENMFVSHSIKADILGTTQSISEINKEILYWIHQHIYQDQHKLLVLSGNVDMEALETYINKLEHSRKQNVHEITFDLPNEPFYVIKENDELIKDMSISRVLIGIKLPEFQDELLFNKMKHSLYIALHTMIGDASDIHQEWIDQDIIHQTVQFHITHVKGANHLVIQVQTDYPEVVLKEIQQIISQDVNKFINIQTFNRLKKTVTASQILSLDQQEFKMFQYLKAYFKNVDMFQIMTVINEVEFKDVVHFGNQLNHFPMSTLIARKK